VSILLNCTPGLFELQLIAQFTNWLVHMG